MNRKNGQKEYTAKDIQVLGDIEHVRKRKGMYIPVGSATEEEEQKQIHHLFEEVIANSVDEAVPGYCDQIKVTLSADQKEIIVEDNGRGIPIEIHPKTKESTLKTIFTSLKSGGKFDDKVYKTAGGLHGVGVTVVNALSAYLKVWNKREGKTEILEFEKGILKENSWKIIDTPQENNGLIVAFTPDQEIFKDFTYFKTEIIQRRLKELAYLNSNLTLHFFKHPGADPVIYHYPGGILNWIKEINSSPLENTEICYEEWIERDEKKEFFQLSFVFQYNAGYGKNGIKSFCNNIRTGGGGTHVEGFEAGLTNACREFIENKYPNLKLDILRNDILEGLTAVIAIKIKEPEFAGQTKDRLANKEVREKTRKLTYELVQKFFQDNSSTAEKVAKKIIDNASIRAEIEERQDLLRGNKEEIVLPGVLSTAEESEEIFFVEGKSAGGSAEEGRDVKTQTILVLQGKPPNALKLVKKVLQNKEIRNVLSILGFGDLNDLLKNNYVRFRHKLEKEITEEELTLPEEFLYEEEGIQKVIPANSPLNFEQIKIIVNETLKRLLNKARYKKIILMADPDPDGLHIILLIIVFFWKHLLHLIQGGKLFVAVPPLYRGETADKQTIFFYNDHELETYRQTETDPRKKIKKIERIKGLGQMEPLELWESTMNPDRRRLYDLTFANNLQETDFLIKELMGVKSDSRKRRLESGEHKDIQLTIREDKQVDISQLALVNFLRYAYEVVEDRALPDVNDGLKPVQRRILYTFYQSGITPNKPEVTSANIVGTTMAEWHPHGDASIYNAMTNMVRKDKFRYPLVYGRGNFGYDKNPPAAMRYTKVRLTPYALFLLEDIAYGTVDWKKNYDDSKEEPVILPTSIPNLLLNGSSGIAVGMSTNIPPHNLGETLTATINLIRNPELTNQELASDLPAPDFPTGGIILEESKLAEIYEKGEGTIHIRAKAEIVSESEIRGKRQKGAEIDKAKKDIIWVTELPYKISKTDLVANIAKLIKDKKIEGLRSVTDYSNWEGIDIRIKFDTNYDGNIVLNKLYRNTRLQSSFPVKMRALLESKPKIFSLKEILLNFISKRLENIARKSKFALRKNEKELDNLETRLFIIINYQTIAEVIKNVSSDEERNWRLRDKFPELSSERINRILDTPISFRQFTPERQNKLEGEIVNLKEENKALDLLINKEENRKERLIADLEQLKKDYSWDVRRTAIIADSHIIDERKSIPREEIIVILSRGEKKRIKSEKEESKSASYLNIHKLNALEATNVGSVGKELKTRGENLAIVKSNRRDDLWCFSNLGKIYSIPVYKLADKSTNLKEAGVLKLAEGEIIEKIVSIREDFLLEKEKKEKYLIILTKKGKIKRLLLEKIGKIPASGKRIINVAKYKDQIIQVAFTSGADDIMVFTKKGKSKSFAEEKVRICGRAAYGDTAIRLEGNIKVRCQKHQEFVEKHKTAPCCDKTQGMIALAKCSSFRELVKEMRRCEDCNKVVPSDDNQIKDEAIGLEIISKDQNREELCLLAIREDSSGWKKPLLSVFKLAKRRGGAGQKSFKVEEKQVSAYCIRHENSITKLEEKRENIRVKAKDIQRKIEGLKKVLSQAQEEKANPEVIKNYEREIVKAKQESGEWKEKIEKNRQEWENAKKKSKECMDCRKNCAKHENLKSKHEEDICCDKKKVEIEALKKKINESKEKGVKPDTIKKYEKEYKELRQSALINRVVCPQFQNIGKEIKKCLDCQDQKKKKATKFIQSLLKKVILTDIKVKSEIYVLAEEAVCWYNKKDLVSFLEDIKKRKIQLYKGKNDVTDIWI